MRLLLDTHIVLWALSDSPRLPSRARQLILDVGNQIFVSVASVWEVQIKHAAHPDRMIVDGRRLCELCHKAGYELMPVEANHVLRLEGLTCPAGTKPHNDPFDRVLICQAIEENMRLVTHDALIPEYGKLCVLFV